MTEDLICVKCVEGYYLYNEMCYLIEFEGSAGLCVTIKNVYTCFCTTPHTGHNCLECEADTQMISGECAEKCVSCNGDCWTGVSGK